MFENLLQNNSATVGGITMEASAAIADSRMEKKITNTGSKRRVKSLI